MPNVRYAWSLSDWDGRACLDAYEIEYGKHLIGRLQAQFGPDIGTFLADMDTGGLSGVATGPSAIVERVQMRRDARDYGRDAYGDHITGTDVQRSARERAVEPPPRAADLDPARLLGLYLGRNDE